MGALAPKVLTSNRHETIGIYLPQMNADEHRSRLLYYYLRSSAALSSLRTFSADKGRAATGIVANAG
jgi:hypothetical protein